MRSAIAFLIGAAVGAVATYFVTKPKYEEVKPTTTEDTKPAEPSVTKEDVAKTVYDNNYQSGNDWEDTEAAIKKVKEAEKAESKDFFSNEDVDARMADVRVISYKDIDEPDWDTVIIMVTSDGVAINDETGEVINTTLAEYVGNPTLSLQFGLFPDDPDTIVVVNSKRECYYEICRSLQTLEELLPKYQG